MLKEEAIDITARHESPDSDGAKGVIMLMNDYEEEAVDAKEVVVID